ncbi:hypothetical protein GTQ99_04710 [Kineococcus sp. T13]|uniref:hypothetical protein n=1 Tax=Kineococcus vitellinus TaxID=2696565 RepID=UPI001411D82C|nr:hypothetical protein [Kineococcus vitellinus]NAZ74725.1 hypothetical protein [Kineococcus vitellinus]
MSVELPEYSFLPWSRRGIATRVDQVDHLGATPDAGPRDRATLSAALTLEAVPVPGAPALAPVSVTQQVSIVGPGDVRGFRPGTVLRVVPVPGSVDATPGELAYVEFYDEDLPWRYTPARATADHRLRPWLVLLVLADGEYSLTPVPGEPAILAVADTAPLPPVTETWAWAHVQAHGDLGAGDPGDLLDARVRSEPDLALSRLLSPRRLDLDTGYRAFVVPAFEVGRLAALGTPAEPGTVPAQRPSWGQGQPRRFPVLHDWSFRTGALTDFEVLARRPRAYRIEADDFGARDLDISDPGAGVDVAPGTTVGLEGALAPVDFDGRTPFPDAPGADVAGRLQAVVDLAVDFRDAGADASEDPIITPPAYARKHAGLERVADATTGDTRWVAELNLDPRNRAAAGLGAEIVRQRDEEYMERAWAQVEELDAVNQRLREADLAIATSERVFAKHIAPAGIDRLLGLTAAAQSALRSAAGTDRTIRGEVDASRVPAAAQAPAFRRITRPARPLMRALTAETDLQDGLLDRLNEAPGVAVSTAPPAAEPVLGVDPTQVSAVVEAVAAQLPRGRDVFPVLAGAAVEARRQAGTLAELTLSALRTAVANALDAWYPPSDPAHTALRDEVAILSTALLDGSLTTGAGDDPTVVEMGADAFTTHYGTAIDGKNHLALVIARESATTLATLAPTAGPLNAAEFAGAFTEFGAFAASRPLPAPAAALRPPAALAIQVAHELRPSVAMAARLATVLGGVPDLSAELANSHRLRPVVAYPTFEDPLFNPLRQLSQDYVIPNITNLPTESISLMVPNVRFIESLLAGVNTELARQLLWHEYPTDQRGTYFRRFFDAADAGADRPPDIGELHLWDRDLGSNAPRLSGLLVLVVRAELLVKFPDTIVFAQHGRYTGTGRRRTLDEAGEVRYPVVRGHLDPDISIYGFELTLDEAAGTDTDAGFFFCFMERPGQLRFGLDLDEDPAAPPPALTSWDDLAWKHLQPVAGQLPAQVLVADNAGLTPTSPGLPGWGQTSAHLASILCQNPVWLARHATDMLPVD